MSNEGNALAVSEETGEREKYKAVNGQWPDVMSMPDEHEAVAAVKRLYRFAFGKPLRKPIKLTSGNRYTHPRSGVWYVNPKGHHFGGWKDLVHDLSHYAHWVKHSHFKSYKPHDANHHFLEKEMVEYVIKSGWLDGKLKSKAKPKVVDKKATKVASIQTRIENWERKRRRAENALKKLYRQQRRLAV